MAKILFLSITLLISLTSVLCEPFRFNNYSLFKVLPDNEKHIKLLQELQDSEINYDFWTDPVPSAEFVSILSSPLYKIALENYLNLHGIKYEITMPNIQEAIDKETVKTYTRNNLRSMTWDAYYNLSDINVWMSDMARAYPDVVTEFVGGVSYEHREIKGLKISHGPGRKIIFVEAGMHSREWITMSTACYIINELLTSTDNDTMAAARDFDWYIIPVANPDGYVWTHTDPHICFIALPGALSRLMWRKNRRPFGTNFGADLNRNWNNNWLVSGASTNPESDTYAGPGPFSEPETRSLSNFIRSVGDIDMYLSFHSFSQLLLIPFGNTTEPVGNYFDTLNIGRRAMGALSVRYGTQYVTGNIAEAIYQATGGSVDWVKEHLQVPIVYCYELRDRGQFGFLLPNDQILQNNQEAMDSVIDLIHQAKRFGYLTGGSAGIQVSLIVMLVALLASLLPKQLF